jgi:hypothetical protein
MASTTSASTIINKENTKSKPKGKAIKEEEAPKDLECDQQLIDWFNANELGSKLRYY